MTSLSLAIAGVSSLIIVFIGLFFATSLNQRRERIGSFIVRFGQIFAVIILILTIIFIIVH